MFVYRDPVLRHCLVIRVRVIRLLRAVGADTFAAWAAPRLEVGYARLSGPARLSPKRVILPPLTAEKSIRVAESQAACFVLKFCVTGLYWWIAVDVL